MTSNREWMYTMRVTGNHIFNPEFQSYVNSFLDFSFSNATVVKYRTLRNGMIVSEIRCPCTICTNRIYKLRQLVECDIYQNGFMPNYYLWYAHGELYPTQDIGQCSNPVPSHHVMLHSSDGTAKHLEILSVRPSQHTLSHNGYFVNGYKFHTREYGEKRVTHNYGVCVRGEIYNAEESDYYGVVDEILEIQYFGKGHSTIVLFKCTWFDNKHGVVVNKNKLVDVKPKSRLQTNDPFILASQAEQLFYTPYPAITRELKDLWAVVKTKKRGVYEFTESQNEVANDEDAGEEIFQIDERFESPDEITSSERLCLVTNTNTTLQVSDNEDEESEAEEVEEELEEGEETDDDEDEVVYYNLLDQEDSDSDS